MSREIDKYYPKQEILGPDDNLDERRRIAELGHKQLDLLERQEESEARALKKKAGELQGFYDALNNLKLQLREYELEIQESVSFDMDAYCDREKKVADGFPVFQCNWKLDEAIPGIPTSRVGVYVFRGSGKQGIIGNTIEISAEMERAWFDRKPSFGFADRQVTPGETYHYLAVVGYETELDIPSINPDIPGHYFVQAETKLVGAVLWSWTETIPDYVDDLRKADFERAVAEKRRQATRAGSEAFTKKASLGEGDDIDLYIAENGDDMLFLKNERDMESDEIAYRYWENVKERFGEDREIEFCQRVIEFLK